MKSFRLPAINCTRARKFSTHAAPKTCIIIGGGIAGVSLSWELSKFGVKVDLLEKSKFLCAGATWHAAGLVTRFGGSPKLKKLHVRALKVLNEIQDKQDISLHRPGSIRIIEKGNKGRYLEALQQVNMAALYDEKSPAGGADLQTSIISPQQIKHLHPLCHIENVECGIWTPLDGDIDPTSLVNYIHSQAKLNGASFHFQHQVIKIEKKKDKFIVSTSNGKQFESDILVNAAGLWSKQISFLLDKNIVHPAFIIEHQYAITESIPFIVERMSNLKEKGRLPVLRDLAGSSYIRQEGTGLLVGPYENNCRLAPDNWRVAPPETFEFNLFQPQLEQIEDNLMSVMKLIPSLSEVGWKSITNGPTIWTGDGLPRCGPVLGIKNYWDFNTLTYGIAQSIPLAEYLAHYIFYREQPFDLAAQCAPGRYGRWATDSYVERAVKDTYVKNNAVNWLFENRPAGREVLSCRSQKLHKILSDLGGVMGFSLSGVETPLVYSIKNNDSKDESNNLSQQFSFSDFTWSKLVQDEVENVIKGVGISHASFSKFRVSGKQSQNFLDYIGTNDVPTKNGTTRLTYSLTKSGKVCAEFTVAKLAENQFYLVGSRDYAGHDCEFLNYLAADPKWSNEVIVEDISNDIEILHICGPMSKKFLQNFSPLVSDIPFLQFRSISIGGVQLNCFRVSFSGLHGFELHCPADQAAEVYSLLLKSEAATLHSLKPFGSLALNSLRVEVGFKIKADLDYAHFTEASIDFFIGKNKKNVIDGEEFIGSASKANYSPQRKAFNFRVHSNQSYKWSIVGDCPIKNQHNEIVGFTTSSAAGGVSGLSLAQGFINAPYFTDIESLNNKNLWLESFGQRFSVEVLTKPASEVTGRKPFPI